mmetsp:Transcript_10652/g.28306  ORF Transcript_10652/g.28306 Transcript_10652/m.28306 type:complete len:346 (+) Transcript_10652:629-1666(+)
MYAALEGELTMRGVALDQLKVVTMIAAGGCPFREYGLGDGLEHGVAIQLSMALEHGIIFDFVPVTFSDFNSHIVSLGVGVGAALLAKLRAREAGRVRMDGVMFACKGTLAAALAARAFVLEDGGGGGGEADDRAKLALFGMGTDLTQGFDDMTDESASACSMQLNLAAMNSLQDTNVGHGEATKAGLEARAARFGGTAVWIDVEARLKEFGTFGTGSNPEHGWYPAAFRRKCCSAVKASILDELACLVGATPCDHLDEVAVAAVGGAAGEASQASDVTSDVGHANVETNVGCAPRGALIPNAMLLDLKANYANGPGGGTKLGLRHVETKVTLLNDFVGNEMFVAE